MVSRALGPRARRVAGILAVALAYAVLYRLVVATSSFSASAGTPFWPPAGLTLAVLLLRPRREWPGYLAAIFATETALDWYYDFGTWVSPIMGVANTVEPLLAAVIVRRVLGVQTPDLSKLRDLGAFLFAGAVAGPLLAALIGSVGPWIITSDAVWPRLGRWYVGDALGVITITPLIVTAARTRTQRISLSGAWALVPFAAVAAVALGPWEFPARFSLPYIVIPALGLVAIRMGTRATVACVFIAAMLVETTTAVGVGPFALHGSFSGLVGAQMFLATGALSALSVAALMSGYVSRGELALHDQLTGVANRVLLLDRIQVACRQIQRRGGATGVLFVDLDGFKQVNDAFGHDAGDRVLIVTADRLRAAVRDEDTVARIGGDEFVVLVAHLDSPLTLSALAARIESSVAEPIAFGAGAVRVGVSVGIASTTDPTESPEALLVRADQAMYAVKRARRMPVDTLAEALDVRLRG